MNILNIILPKYVIFETSCQKKYEAVKATSNIQHLIANIQIKKTTPWNSLKES